MKVTNDELYRGSAVLPRTPRKTVSALLITAALCAVVFFIAEQLPASWLFELCTVAAASVRVNKILREGTFTVTYVLTDGILKIYTRYGLIEKLTDVVYLDNASVSADRITHGGRIIRFYPDKKLKKLLNI